MQMTTASMTQSAPATRASESKAAKGIAAAASASEDRSVTLDAIRLRAHQKWEAAGKPEGDCLKFWLEAERKLLESKRTGP